MKIRTKIFFITGIIFLSLLVIGFLSYLAFLETSKYNDEILHDISLVSNLQKLNGLMKDILYTPNLIKTYNDWLTQVERFEEATDRFINSSVLEVFFKNPDLKADFEYSCIVLNMVLSNSEAVKTGIDALKAEGTLGNTGLYFQLDLLKLNEDFMQTYLETKSAGNYFSTSLENVINPFISLLQIEIKDIQNQIIFIFIVTIVIIVVLTSVIIILFSRDITKKIKLVETSIKSISKGDFSGHVKIKAKDEFGNLSDNINQFIVKLKKNVDLSVAFMQEVSKSITLEQELDKIIDIITDSIFANTYSDGAVLLMVDEKEKLLKVKSLKGDYPPPFRVPEIIKTGKSKLKSHFLKSEIKLGENILGKTAQTGKPVFIKNISSDPELSKLYNEEYIALASIIAVPLIISSRVIGVVSIITVKKNNYLTDLDFSHMCNFADYAALTIENFFSYRESLEKKEIQREIDIASTIQKQLLPGKIFPVKNADISAYSRSAKGVGGDYYDVVKLSDTKIALIICDVAGKGVPASLIMVIIRTIFHLITSPKRDVSNILTWINRGMLEKIKLDHFATISLITYDIDTKLVTYTSAGHLPLLLYRDNKSKIISVDIDNIPVGIEKSVKYKQKQFKLNSNDILVFYTDGITEAMDRDGNMFTVNSLKNKIVKNKNFNSDKIVSNIISDINTFTDGSSLHDDQTLLVMKCS